MCGPLTTFSLQVLNGPSTTTTPDGTRMGILHRTVPSSQEESEDGKHHGASGCIQPAKSLSWRLRSLGVLLPRAPWRIHVGHLTKSVDRQGSVGQQSSRLHLQGCRSSGAMERIPLQASVAERFFPSAIRLVKLRSRKRRGTELS